MSIVVYSSFVNCHAGSKQCDIVEVAKQNSNACNRNRFKKELEFMFMKHYAPNRCEPNIEVIMKMGVVGVGFFFFFFCFFFWGGGVRVDVKEEVKL